MFHLVNEHGNVHKWTKSERKRDELIAAGYKPVEETTAEELEQADEPQQADGTEEPKQGEEKPKKGKAKKNAAEE